MDPSEYKKMTGMRLGVSTLGSHGSISGSKRQINRYKILTGMRLGVFTHDSHGLLSGTKKWLTAILEGGQAYLGIDSAVYLLNACCMPIFNVLAETHP